MRHMKNNLENLAKPLSSPDFNTLIFGGGTLNHVRGHLALCAPAYGNTAKQMKVILADSPGVKSRVCLTKMADPESVMESNADVERVLADALKNPALRAIFFNIALCDFHGRIGRSPSGKYAPRMSSRDGDSVMHLSVAGKLLPTIKQTRPDILLIGSKTTLGASKKEQIDKSLRQIQETGADAVLANDTQTRQNLLVQANGEVLEQDRPIILQAVAHMVELFVGARS